MGAVSGSGLSLGTLWIAIVANVDEALQQLQKFTNDVGQMVEQQKQKFEGLATVGESFSKIGTALTVAVTAPLVGVGAAAVKVSEQLNQARVSFATMLGSAQAADKMLKDLQKFAATTPFEFPELVDAAKRMQALGVSAQQVIPWLTAIGNAASAMGGGKEVIDGITLALGQMSAKGKVSAQEMNQLAERGIPAWQLLADKIGTSIPEAMKLAEKGAISASTAIPAILEGMNQKFGGSMEALNKTLTGQWSNFKDKITQALIPIGEALTPMLQTIVKVMTPLLGLVADVAELFVTLPEPVKAFAVGLAAVAAAIGPLLLVVGQLAVGIAAIGPALGALGLGITVSVGALVGWAAAIGVAAAALVAFGVWVSNNWDRVMSVITGALAFVVDAFEGLIGILAKVTAFIPGVGSTLSDFDGDLKNLSAQLELSSQEHGKLADAAEQAAERIPPAVEKIKQSWDDMAKAAATHFGKAATEAVKATDIIAGAMQVASDLQDKRTAEEKKAAEQAKTLGVQTIAQLQQNVKDRKRILEEWIALEKQGILKHADVVAATQAVTDAEKALADGSKNVKAAREAAAAAAAKLAKETEELGKKEIAHEKAMAVIPSEYYRWIQSIDDWNQKADEHKKKLEEQRQAQLDAMIAAANMATSINSLVTPAVEQLTQRINDLASANATLKPQVDATYEALKKLGLKAADVFRSEADDAKAAYDTLEAEGKASLYQLTQARLIWLEKEKEAALAAGEIWSAADQAEIEALKKTLDQMEQKTAKHTQKTKTIWQEWAKSIGQTIQQFIGSVIERVFGGSDINKQLDEQAADLQKSLAERSQEYDQFLSDNAAKQQKAAQDYEDSLAKEDEAFANAIADKKKEFDDYAASIPELMAKAEQEAAGKLAETTGDLKRELADRTADYQRYSEDVGNAIEEIKTKHADELAGELEDLESNLDDRRQAYEDFVQDAATKLARLREDSADNIADETQDVSDNIRDRTTDYQRFAQDTAKKIQKLREKNGGVYSDEEDDLATSLKRREEDLQQYITDQNRDLQTFVQRQQQKQREEEQDLQTSLDRKQRDQQEYEQGIQKQRDETTAKHQAQQQQEIADQQLALARRTQDYETYVADNKAQMDKAVADYQIQVDTDRAALEQSLTDRRTDLDQFTVDALGKHEQNRQDIKQTYANTTTDLETELAKQKADYEAFKEDIIGPGGQLEQLKEQHRSIWEDIGSLVVGALGKIGEKFLEIAGEKYLGVLLTKLGELIGAGNKIGEIFGTIGASQGGAGGGSSPSSGGGGGTSSTPGGGVGAAAGGALGIVNAITGAVSAVSDVISAIYSIRQEGTLNAIEHNTRYGMMYLGERSDGGILGILFKIDEELAWGNLTKATEAIKDAFIGFARDALVDLDDMKAKLWTLPGLSDAMWYAKDALFQLVDQAETATSQELAFFDRMSTALDRIALSSERSVNMNLYGTDPTVVATQIATQLRLQGGRA